MKDRKRSHRCAQLIAMLACSVSTPVLAQETPPPAAASEVAGIDSDIVVTARRRAESLTSAPVAVSAVGSAELQRRAIVRLDNLASAVPQLIISDAGASTQGGVVLIRGIGVGESNPFADQAVSFNVDGVQVGRAAVRRMSEVDMAQVEVLKGPQALFFGKNSPAGIIVIRTADPGATFEAGVNASYEFRADEYRTDFFVSGPLADGLGARLAVYGSDMKGYFDNVATPSATLGPSNKRLPTSTEYGGRITLKYDGGANFDARLKLNYSHLDASGPESNIQTVNCPLGYDQLAPVRGDCSADDRIIIPDLGPLIGNYASEFQSVPYTRQDQVLAGLELNLALGDHLKLTSLTGYYLSYMRFVTNASVADSTVPAFIFGGSQRFRDREISQELRLASSFDEPFNFLLGAYYQDADLQFSNYVLRNALAPTVIGVKQPVFQDGTAYSFFAQAMINITPTLELSGGGRYSHEKKGYRLYDAAGNRRATASNGKSWDNFSPEVTLTYRPSHDLTIYGAYKTGFLSGGFAVSSGDLTLDRSFNQQTVHGFEGGIKVRSPDGRLRGSLIGYHYTHPGLQVTANIIDPVRGVDQRIVNAGKATNKGFELEGSFQATEQLSLHAAFAYNHGRYNRLITTCYSGQSIAMGCNLNPNAAGVFTAQDLSGQQMVRAPDVVAQGGISYTVPLGSNGDTLNLSADGNYSSSYFAAPSNKPQSRQGAYATLDLGAMYTNEGKGFSIGVLGRNLTNKYYFSRAIDSTFTGSGTGTATVTPSDTIASVSRGRQVMVRFSAKFH
ncbi:TonB-dependent receptor [Sphingomonas sp. CL5.1]|uniref:TonB-dependent receptor n=1 Tax=Sphingomonas sp. CL5.1 TaxID=2653203 RepID=UPI001584131A|nr:TonB-dependent receptor [Sphingomonas sp. CL5.1]QKR98383.1 TonB-dependent receptor [Sphingomonas sp. CL5.1]